jgi:glycerophosphoryl diester phosphodiesterase
LAVVGAGFDLQGHRGARGLFPENTLFGFAGAVAIGVASIELDIAVTRDGVPVVVHDPVLDPDLARGPDGESLRAPPPVVGRLTLAELRRFDVGRARAGGTTRRAFPTQAARDGERVPTLADVFAATATSGVRIDAELKTDPRAPDLTVTPADMAERVVAVAREAGALGRLSLRSFDWRGPRHARRRFPDLPIAWLTDAATEAAAALWWDVAGAAAVLSTPRAVAAAARAEGDPAWTPVWAPQHDTLTAAGLAEAHALRLRVVPWTVNRPADMARLIAWGVDGLCTDRPDLARAVMAQAGLTLPPRCPA